MWWFFFFPLVSQRGNVFHPEGEIYWSILKRNWREKIQVSKTLSLSQNGGVDTEIFTKISVVASSPEFVCAIRNPKCDSNSQSFVSEFIRRGEVDKPSQTGHIHSRISPEHLTQSLLQSWLLGLTCLWVSCGAGRWHFKPSWQGVRVPTFRLNGATRQMILTATHPSAFDSIKRCEVASTLSEELSKVPLISSSRMSTRRCSFNLYTPLNIAAPYVNCHWECLLVAWHRCSGIHLQRGLETEVMRAICVWQKHFCFNFLFIKVCSASNSEDRTRTLLPALALTLGLLYYKCIKFNEMKDQGLWRYFTCIFANFSLCICDGWEE